MLDESCSMRMIHLIKRQKLKTDTDVSWHSSWVCVRVSLLIGIEVGRWEGIRALIREGETSPDPRLCYTMKFKHHSWWDSVWDPHRVFGTVRWPCFFHSVVWWGCGGVPALLVCLFPLSGAGKPAGKGICGCPHWRGINMRWQNPFCLVNKTAMYWWLPFLHPTCPQISV